MVFKGKDYRDIWTTGQYNEVVSCLEKFMVRGAAEYIAHELINLLEVIFLKKLLFRLYYL